MEPYQHFFDIAAGVLAAISYLPYMRAILRGETKPSRSSWIIWTLLSWLTGASMFGADSLNIQIATVMVGDLAIIILAMKYGMSGWNHLDSFCIAGGLFGILAWVITMNPLVGLIIILLVTIIGGIPTIVKTWHHPDKEDSLAYMIMIASCIAEMIALPEWSIAKAGQPVVFFSIASTVLFLALTRPRAPVQV